MKKLLSIIISACMIVALMPIAGGGVLTQSIVFADDGTEYTDTTTDLEYKLYSNEKTYTATVTGYTGSQTSIFIPSTVTVNNIQYTVTAIGSNAFQQNEKINLVKIPNTVKSIEANAFEKCKNLYLVIFEPVSQLKKIGTGAFNFCTKLMTIDIPKSVESIGSSAFRSCKLKTITFEEDSKLNAIGKNAFSMCNMSTITIPASVTQIGESAFYFCSNLTKVTFEDGSNLVTIGDSTFSKCEKLATINFGGTKEQWDALKVTLSTLTTGITTVKMSQAAPSAVEADTIGYNTITLKKINRSTTTDAKAEYRIANGEWQDDTTFTGLTANTNYNFEARYKAITVTDTTATIDYAPSNAVPASLTTASDSSSGTGASGGSSIQKPTVVTPTNGTITILSDGTTAVIRPNEGYEIVSVLLNGNDKGTFPVLMNLKSSDRVEATFREIASSGSGSAGDSGDLSVQKPTIAETQNGEVTLSADGCTATITPNEGYEVVKVILNGKDMGAPTTLDRLKTGDEVKVTFQKTGEELAPAGSTVYSGGGSSSGSVTQKPTVITPEHGKITLSSNGRTATITPDEGYEIESVMVNGTDKGAVTMLTDLKTGDNVEVTFRESREALISIINSVVKIAVAELDTVEARSSKTSKGNTKVVMSLSDDEMTVISGLTDLDYTVKYKFYRSTGKSSGYEAKIEKDSRTYINTAGKKGTRYYYKARIMVYDADGNLIAGTALKQCKYTTKVF